MMSWRRLIHGHEIIRYDRELAWECIHCPKKWPMAPELVRASGIYTRQLAPLPQPVQETGKSDQEDGGFFQRPPSMSVAITPQLPPGRS
jgi:hypothetical protein